MPGALTHNAGFEKYREAGGVQFQVLRLRQKNKTVYTPCRIRALGLGRSYRQFGVGTHGKEKRCKRQGWKHLQKSDMIF